MTKLVATRPIYLSGIGSLKPGDIFNIAQRDARVLRAIGKARTATLEDDPVLLPSYRQQAMRIERREVPVLERTEVPEQPESAQRNDDEDAEAVRREHVIQALRVRAAALGVDVDGRWGEERLRREIADAGGNRYSRRDMRSEPT